ncbi:hypothetical protein OAP63_14430 [Vibrio sp.]|uniref:Uncharacterized protein n=1 Tax=Vibrio viridaestus TaxID=2487322 RepID=A0A3N9U770_9VIBR|nr:hypothetical protein [Vibrio viridaestus]MDC0611925.1 hypothetical protein [Vibrio sp.]RQW64006.1 hypothetical protein EES38_05215 [Vibrio viridaestus]
MEIVFILLCFAVFGIYMAIKTSKQKNSSSTSDFTVSMTTSLSSSISDDIDNIDQDYEEISPIPYDDREKLTINNERYYVVWKGTSPESTFSVNRKEKITMTPNHVLVKDMAIFVADINEDNTKIIPTLSISSQIQVKGHNRRSFWEWMRIINPNFPWSFHRAYPEYETCERDYSVMWEGQLAPTTFSRIEYGGERKRETVKPIGLYKGKLTGVQKLKFLDSKDKEITFNTKYIDTMLATEGHKKKHFDDWVNSVLLSQPKADEVIENINN